MRSPLLLLAVVAMTLLSALSGLAEMRPFSSLAVSDREKFIALETDLVHPGLSYYSQGIVLDTCLNAMTSIYARLQSTERRDTVATRCRNLASEIVRNSPTYSYAWLIEARAAQDLRNSAKRDQALLRSQETAPSELWLAELRFQLFEDSLTDMQADARANTDRDVLLLLSTMRGRATVIRRFIQVPGSRERITRIAEQLPEELKSRFLDEAYGLLPKTDAAPAPEGGST